MTKRSAPAMLSRARHRRAPRHAAVAMLEFAYTIPVFLFMVMLSVDIGQIMLLKGGLQDATYAAARAGAQTGTPGTSDRGDVRVAWDSAAQHIVMLHDPSHVTMQVLSPTAAQCGNDNGAENNTNPSYVVVETDYSPSLIMPGLARLINLMNSSSHARTPNFTLVQRAVARCEIVPVQG